MPAAPRLFSVKQLERRSRLLHDGGCSSFDEDARGWRWRHSRSDGERQTHLAMAMQVLAPQRSTDIDSTQLLARYRPLVAATEPPFAAAPRVIPGALCDSIDCMPRGLPSMSLAAFGLSTAPRSVRAP